MNPWGSTNHIQKHTYSVKFTGCSGLHTYQLEKGKNHTPTILGHQWNVNGINLVKYTQFLVCILDTVKYFYYPLKNRFLLNRVSIIFLKHNSQVICRCSFMPTRKHHEGSLVLIILRTQTRSFHHWVAFIYPFTVICNKANHNLLRRIIIIKCLSDILHY